MRPLAATSCAVWRVEFVLAPDKDKSEASKPVTTSLKVIVTVNGWLNKVFPGADKETVGTASTFVVKLYTVESVVPTVFVAVNLKKYWVLGDKPVRFASIEVFPFPVACVGVAASVFPKLEEDVPQRNEIEDVESALAFTTPESLAVVVVIFPEAGALEVTVGAPLSVKLKVLPKLVP